MERIQNQSHSKETLLYSLSNMLERASYYGIRTLLVLYMVTGSLQMDKTEALSIMGWFGLSVIIAQIIGALLGDLVIGNRKAIILGGILNAVGAFCLSIPSAIGLYSGLFLVVLGGGLYRPNVSSNFGKLYLNKTKLLASGFTLLYLAIDLGAFLGISLIGYLEEIYSWSFGFIMGGMLMLCSIVPILIGKETKVEEVPTGIFSVKQRITKISIAFLLVALFWTIYEISDIRFFDLKLEFREVSILNLSKYMQYPIDLVLLLFMGIFAVVLWTNFYFNSFLKLVLGGVFACIAYCILLLIPENPTEEHTVLYLGILFFLSISEVHISPIVDTVLTKYTKPKYLAIAMSLAFIPTRVFSFVLGLFSEDLYKNTSSAMWIGMIAMLILTVASSAYFLIKKEKNPIL